MKELGYGSGYRYDHDEPGGVAAQTFLPERLAGSRFYHAGDQGREAEIAARLRRSERLRKRGAADDPGAGDAEPDVEDLV
jgi:putative ATPase